MYSCRSEPRQSEKLHAGSAWGMSATCIFITIVKIRVFILKKFCKNHSNKIAPSFCCICKNYYCKECLIEGQEYYYCHQTSCYNEYLKERKKDLESYELNPRFCPKCLDETFEESTGNLHITNFIGTTITRNGGHCNICNSYIA